MIKTCFRESIGQFFLSFQFVSLEVTQSSVISTLLLESRNDCHMYPQNM